MYELIKNYADKFDPLSIEAEESLISSGKTDEELLGELLKHNARMIIAEIHRWRNTYDLDEACSIVIERIVKSFPSWNRRDRFSFFIYLRIKSALHDNIRRYSISQHEDIDDHLDIVDCSTRGYDDIWSLCEAVLDDGEYDLIRNIYFNGEAVKSSAMDLHSSSISRKHHRILEKLRKYL